MRNLGLSLGLASLLVICLTGAAEATEQVKPPTSAITHNVDKVNTYNPGRVGRPRRSRSGSRRITTIEEFLYD